MFSNASNVDASHSTFSEVHRDQYNSVNTIVHGSQNMHTIIYGNQIYQGRNASLESLYKTTASSAAFDSAERYPAPTCLSGTRADILRRICDWIETSDSPPICWLSGMAGSGKSAIAQSIAETFAAQKRLAASFFFSRRELERCSTQHFFPTLASQFMIFLPSMRAKIAEILDEDFTTPTKVLREQMQKLLLEPLKTTNAKFTAPVLMVVDSLDECDNEKLVAELISLLTQLTRGCPFALRILVTSRAESHIRAKFREQDILALTYSLELQTFDSEEDIRSFLRHAFGVVLDENQVIMADEPRPWPKDLELESIAKKASGLFIFAITVVKYVGARHHDPRKRLEVILADRTVNPTGSAFSDLDTLYQDAIRIFPDIDATRLILGVIRHLSIPLTVRGLNNLLKKLDVNAGLVVNSLGSVLLVLEDGLQPVRIYHASFREFLANPQRAKQFFVDGAVYHRLIAQLCFEVMSKHLKRDMCSIKDPSMLNREITSLPDLCNRYIDESVRYACCYWAYHLAQVPNAGRLNDQLVSALQTFFQESLLYWVETLSLLGFLDTAVMMLRDTSSWLKQLSSPPKSIIDFVNDAERFVLMFLDPISQSALQVYYTGLPFTPSSTLVGKTFQRELRGAVTILSGQWDQWDASIRAISLTGSIQSIAFSPDGKLLASASDCEGVQLWNAVTGVNVANLDPGEKPSCAVRFSPSGAYVAVGCGDGSVTMWDSLTGQVIINDDEHDEPIKSVIFSHNSAILASASRTYIQLRDVSQGCSSHRVPLEGTVLSFAFSFDDRLLVAGCDDAMAIIWDLGLATPRRRLKGHNAAINCVAVSDDNTLLASGSDDRTVRIWDIRTGVCLRTYSGHDNPIIAVRLTPDSGHVISICRKVVGYSKISKKKSFACIWSSDQFFRNILIHAPGWNGLIQRILTTRLGGQFTFTDDDSSIISDFSPGFDFAFSCNGVVLLASSLKPLSHHPPRFGSLNDAAVALALSSDTTRVSSANVRGVIQIWDPTIPMWDWKRITGLMTEIIEVLVPSPDGRYCLVRALFDTRLLDANGRIIKTLEGDSIATSDLKDDKKTNMAFSPDSNTFAYWSDDFRSLYTASSIRIYDSATGKRISRCSGIAKIECVKFSPDGARIACGNGEGILKIWNVASSKAILTIAPPSPFVLSSIAFSPDGSKIVGGTSEGHVKLWDTSNGQSITNLDGHGSRIRYLVFTPDASRIIYYHEDNSIHVWSPPSTFAHSLTSNNATLSALEMLVCSDTDGTITCRSEDGSISVWTLPKDIKSVDHIGSDEASKGSFCEMCYHQPDSQTANPHLISQSETGNVYDKLLRSAYVFREDGWIYDGTRRLFWLPSAFRPISPSSMVAYQEKLWIEIATEKILVLDISALDYRLKRDSQLGKPEFLKGKSQQ